MSDAKAGDLHTDAVLRAHLRQIVIHEVLASLTPTQAEGAISAAVQRLSQYLDEGPVSSIAKVATQDQFRAMIDQITEELRRHKD